MNPYFMVWSLALVRHTPALSNQLCPMIPTTTRRFLSTRYTIHQPGVNTRVLEERVKQNWINLPRFLSEKPVATHTKEAFVALQEQLDGTTRPIILDSGCGTGRSTLHLGNLYPNHIVIGIDRSLVRLCRNGVYRESMDGKNVFLVRAELVEFWRQWQATPLGPLDQHFLFYPNPYPKPKRFPNRWYAHSSFPLLYSLGANEITLRSNWKAYLDDFFVAMSTANRCSPGGMKYRSNGLSELDPASDPWTNFEAKYYEVGESCYEMRFLRQ